MNAITTAMIGNASTNATPMNIVVCRTPRASGWRAIPSTVFETIRPLPIPAPSAAKPTAIAAANKPNEPVIVMCPPQDSCFFFALRAVYTQWSSATLCDM